DKLIAWQKSERRKPLILWGARQVGKTWLMKEFGEKYFDNYVYISFYNNKRISNLFEQNYDAKRILRSIEIELHTKIEPNKNGRKKICRKIKN
ncbi:MAG: AAA family ATPase, partial [Bacteroidales bacterium]|nr:AAA family ATPase [Bacteroidales bacterium]